MGQAYKNNNAGKDIFCSQCDEIIEVGDICWKEDKNSPLICELCYEDNHEYDSDCD